MRVPFNLKQCFQQPVLMVRIKGGHANQIIQYYVAWALAKKTNRQLVLDTTYLLKPSQRALSDLLQAQQVHPILAKKTVWLTLCKAAARRYGDDLALDQLATDSKHLVYLNGYFQDQRFTQLIDCEQALQDLCAVVDSKTLATYERLQQQSPLCMHIRRGDYLKPNVRQVHGVCSRDYFLQAFAWFQSQPEVIFDQVLAFTNTESEARAWVQEHLQPTTGLKLMQPIAGDLDDLLLMAACRYHIISNSSFSWLASLLCARSDKITLSPNQWFLDPKLQDQMLLHQHQRWLSQAKQLI